MEQLEQRYCIKFCQKLANTQVKTIHKIQQAFGDDAMSISRINEWFNRFKDGRTSVDSESRPGRPSTN
jgi:transposase